MRGQEILVSIKEFKSHSEFDIVFLDWYFVLQIRATNISETKFHLKNPAIWIWIFHKKVLENLEMSWNFILRKQSQIGGLTSSKSPKFGM